MGISNFKSIKRVRKAIYLVKSPYSLKHPPLYVHFNKTTWFFFLKNEGGEVLFSANKFDQAKSIWFIGQLVGRQNKVIFFSFLG